jgi:hypothetical protein
MLEMLDIGVENALAFRMSGKITEEDMARVLSEAKEKIARHGQISIFEQIDSFEGIEFSALIEEFRYVIDVGFSNINKAAILTDKKWVANVVKVEDKIFRSIDMQCFPIEERDAAIAFLMRQ